MGMTIADAPTLDGAYRDWFHAENRTTAYLRWRRLMARHIDVGADYPLTGDELHDVETLTGYYQYHKVGLTDACEGFRQLGVLTTDDLLAISTADTLAELWKGMWEVSGKVEAVRLNLWPDDAQDGVSASTCFRGVQATVKIQPTTAGDDVVVVLVIVDGELEYSGSYDVKEPGS